MAENTKLVTELTGDATSLMTAIQKATHGFEAFSKDAKKNVGEIDGSFANLTHAFSNIKQAIAGLAVFHLMKEAVDATVEMGAEVRRLSGYFSISKERAGELAEALHRMGSSPEEFIGMNNKLVKSIEKNAEVFEAYGVKTKRIGKDGQLEWRKQIDISMDAGAALNAMDGPTERAQAAIKMFGRSGGEAAVYFRKLAEEAKNSKDNLEAMGVAIDYEHLASESKKYMKAQKDINQTFDVMKLMAGQELLPSLTDLARFFASILGPAAQGIALIIKGVTSAFWGLKAGVEMVVANLVDFYLKGVAFIKGFGSAISKLISGDVKGAIKAATDADAEITRIDEETAKIRADIAEDFWKKQESIYNKPHTKPEADEDGGGKVKAQKLTPEQEKAIENQMKNELEDLRKQTADKLGIERDFFQLSASETLDFWRHQQAIHRESVGVINFTEKEVSAARVANLKETEDKLKKQLDLDLANHKHNYDEQIHLAEVYFAAIAKNHRAGSAENLAAAKIVADLRNKAKEELKKYNDEVESGERAHRVAMIGLDLERIKIMQTNGEMGDEEALRRTIDLNERLYQEERKSLIRRLALEQLAPAEIKKVLNQIQAIEDTASKRRITEAEQLRRELEKKSPNAGMKAAAQDYVKAATNNMQNFKNAATAVMSAAESGISGALKGMITGQMTFGEAMKSIWSSITDAVLGAITKMIAQWVVAAAAQAVFGASTQVTENTKAAASLDTASAETWAAYAGIPFIGPALAAAQQALILTSFAASKVANRAATAYASGGLVTQPHLGLVGEAGREYIVPDRDMKSLIPGLMESGARIYSAMARSQARTQNSYKSATFAPSKTLVNSRTQGGHTINVSGVIGDKRQLGTYLKGVLNDHTLVYGSAL